MQGLGTGDQIGIVVGIAGAVLVIALAAIAILEGRRRRHREAETAAKLFSREIAVIVEETRPTAGGVLALILLVLTIGFTVVSYLAAKTVFQQIESGVSLIAGCIIWGLGVALGRSRTYRVYRPESGES